MARYLIEVPHEAKAKECLLAVKVLLRSGSHYLTNAEFGCLDGEHKAWIIIDVDSKEQAKGILPPVYRPRAKVVQLNRFCLEEIENLLQHHAQ